jgi:hypothetical protein
MSNNKTIQLNPIFFSSGGKSSTPKKAKKEKPQVSLQPNKMKKQLLAKIKDFQNNTEKEETKAREKEKEEFDEGFADEFNKSLNFLSELSKQRKQKPKGRNETLKKGKVEQAVHLQISTELPEELKVEKLKVPMKIQMNPPVRKPIPVPVQIPAPVTAPVQAPMTGPISAPAIDNISLKPTPVYSNLKGGSRPTYRQYHNKTQKNYGPVNAPKPLIQIDNIEAHAHAQAQVQVVKEEEEAPVVVAQTKPRFKKRITRTLKYSLGKHKNGKVSVLIKNAKTRRKIQTEQAILKQKSISDIKIYLRSKNLLKVGSEVPNDVLRQMYESAILAGDVTNKSKDTLLHNFFNEK